MRRARRAPSPYDDVTEKSWLQQVVDGARRLRWEAYHTHDARKSEFGFPDVVLVRPPRVIFAELKTETTRGRGQTTAAQTRWLEALRGCPGVEVYLWRPSDADMLWGDGGTLK